jgi:CRISPR-associated protein Cmr5
VRYDKQQRAADQGKPQEQQATVPAASVNAADALPLVALARDPAGPGRRQQVLQTVYERVSDIAKPENAVPDGAKEQFGNLCHSVPVLLGTNGLCQTLAFIEHKIDESNGDRKRAFALLRGEIAHLLGFAPGDVLKNVRERDVLQYQRHTRTILDAWIFYKRFAVTILQAPAGTNAANGPA